MKNLQMTPTINLSAASGTRWCFMPSASTFLPTSVPYLAACLLLRGTDRAPACPLLAANSPYSYTAPNTPASPRHMPKQPSSPWDSLWLCHAAACCCLAAARFPYYHPHLPAPCTRPARAFRLPLQIAMVRLAVPSLADCWHLSAGRSLQCLATSSFCLLPPRCLCSIPPHTPHHSRAATRCTGGAAPGRRADFLPPDRPSPGAARADCCRSLPPTPSVWTC